MQRIHRVFCQCFKICIIYVCTFLLFEREFIFCDDVNTNMSLDFATTVNSFVGHYNNSTEFNESINVVNSQNQTEVNISDYDVATELDSSLSITEDSENSPHNELERKSNLFTSDEDLCICDLTLNFCDVNCCCDSECSEDDTKAFSECYHQFSIYDENYCYREDIIIKNNTIYKMEKNPSNSLFCIVHNNFKEKLRFKDVPVIKSLGDLNTIVKYKSLTTYSWISKTSDNFPKHEWKAGNPISVTYTEGKKSLKRNWDFPFPCLSDFCSCYQDVLYLIDFESTCTYVVDWSKGCDNRIFSRYDFNFCISSDNSDISNSISDLIIHTKMLNDSSNEEYISTQKHICVNINPLKPQKNMNRCDNVINKIHFVVEHEGALGIRNIKAHFLYTNITIGSPFITQTYSVNYTWKGVSNYEKKSGNPGYLIGYPIITTTNVTASGTEEVTAEVTPLAVIGSLTNSFCDMGRHIVKFGKNFKTGCYLKHKFSKCKDIQNKVSNTLLGTSETQVFVGIFGNANVSLSEDWIEAFYNKPESSNSDECWVNLDLEINIIYTAVGTFSNPQFKIIGIGYQYVKPKYINLPCDTSCDDIMLTTSVSFFDVTQSVIHHYAKIPSIKVNLPSDFFYPFLYGKSVKVVYNVYVILFLTMLIYII